MWSWWQWWDFWVCSLNINLMLETHIYKHTPITTTKLATSTSLLSSLQSLLRIVNMDFWGDFLFGWLFVMGWSRNHEWVDKGIEKGSKGVNQVNRAVKHKAFCQLPTWVLLNGRYNSTGGKLHKIIFYKITYTHSFL